MAAACLTRSSWAVAADEAAVPAWLRQEEGVHPTSSTVAFCVGRRGCRPPPGLWHRREPRPASASPVASTRERWQQSAVRRPAGWEGPFDLRAPGNPGPHRQRGCLDLQEEDDRGPTLAAHARPRPRLDPRGRQRCPLLAEGERQLAAAPASLVLGLPVMSSRCRHAMGRPWAGRRRVVGGFVLDVGPGETTLVLFAAGASRRLCRRSRTTAD